MITILRDTTVRARKHYQCDACDMWCREGLAEPDITADEALVVDGARADRWKITPGMEYRKVVYTLDGDLLTYRGRLDMDALCLRHGLHED